MKELSAFILIIGLAVFALGTVAKPFNEVCSPSQRNVSTMTIDPDGVAAKYFTKKCNR